MRAAEIDPLWDIVEEHLDEAEFLWEAWQHSLVAPDYTLDEVAEGPEERLMAHIDGLVRNGPLVARRLLIPALDDDEPARVSAAATALLLGPDPDAAFAAILEVLRDRPEQRGPLVQALACADVPALRPRLRELLAEHDGELVAAAAGVLTAQREPLGDTLGLLFAGEATTRALALRALADEPEPLRYARAVQANLQELDPTVLDAAIDAGVRLGLAPAWARACERVHDPDGAASLVLLALRGTASDDAALAAALCDRKRRLAALWALGFRGTPEAVDAAIEWLEDDAAAPLAGEVFTAVTGVDLDAARMALPRDRADEALVHRPEDDLPRPDPLQVLKWWTNHRGRFAAGQRYLAGAPYSSHALLQALRFGAMRRRPNLLLALTLDLPPASRPRLRLTATATRQRREVDALLHRLPRIDASP
ncbi:TIGR02270 family protein [Nannocystis pusilla]|uniref:TIGR02270 family protein n=1 Tax=Nannocystis pusilla TaxID=889268 RepID=A0ABS7U2V8_9BACT|nr:TIGR02270 family protein [Nannocystis pusilla]MBZ5714685.1 TIGR02270 family protein [Nannocystis pusilla]